MKHPHLDLSHLKRCNQYWDEMEPCEGGRLCTQCNHVIRDFRGKPDWEIALAFANRNGGRVCGIYDEDRTKAPTRNGFKIAITDKMLAAGLFGLMASTPLAGQEPDRSEPIVVQQRLSDTIPQNPTTNAQPDRPQSQHWRVLQGKVLDAASGEELIGANILVAGSDYRTTTDIEGNFAVTESDTLLFGDSLQVICAYIGYETLAKTVLVKDINEQTRITFELQDGSVYMEDFVVYGPGRRIWTRFTNLFRRRR